MSEKHETATAEEHAVLGAAEAGAAAAFESNADLQGAASFAAAESREILNLLGDAEAGGSCCGGSCCGT